jgi:monoterpene epsilon-lactone hydrolase
MLHGSRCASWNLAMEVGTEVMRRQLRAAFEISDVREARRYLDSVAIPSAALSKVSTVDIVQKDLKGAWFIPPGIDSGLSTLYLHGGGYSFYPRGFYNNLAALVALSTKSQLFAPDYRLSPEHKFPAQLEDAVTAYQWLLQKGVDAKKLVVLGDSAGGNLALALLLTLRNLKLPSPGMAVCLSPATDFQSTAAVAQANAEYDWITAEMALRWSGWFCSPEERSNPLVSPLNANLTGLPPIYIQAGASEILLPGIEEFARRAKQQGADVTLEIWPGMNHDFQAFGYDVPQSMEALQRIGEVVTSRLVGSNSHTAVP